LFSCHFKKPARQIRTNYIRCGEIIAMYILKTMNQDLNALNNSQRNLRQLIRNLFEKKANQNMFNAFVVKSAIYAYPFNNI
jgi:hypothetical protein